MTFFFAQIKTTFSQCGRVPPGRKAPTKISQVTNLESDFEINAMIFWQRWNAWEQYLCRKGLAAWGWAQQTAWRLGSSHLPSIQQLQWNKSTQASRASSTKQATLSTPGYMSRASTAASTRVGASQEISTSSRGSETNLASQKRPKKGFIIYGSFYSRYHRCS